MLKPLAIAVIGALSISVVLSLVATPTVFALMAGGRETPPCSLGSLERRSALVASSRTRIWGSLTRAGSQSATGEGSSSTMLKMPM